MGLAYVVITSVTRDDLADGGAAHFAATIRAAKAAARAKVEVLVSDFGGSRGSIATVLEAGPDVFNHNVETVERLYPTVRPQADYRRSLGVLRAAKEIDPDVITKSGLMVGLGETTREVEMVFEDLLSVGCSVITVGQYLAPSKDHIPVARFVEPKEFDRLRNVAEDMGFAAACCDPFVRSSYLAENVFSDVLHSGMRLDRRTRSEG
jgi:lipoic acid synthetase